jgi:NMD protein affecting ribosome stability and mRNA decay
MGYQLKRVTRFSKKSYKDGDIEIGDIICWEIPPDAHERKVLVLNISNSRITFKDLETHQTEKPSWTISELRSVKYIERPHIFMWYDFYEWI